MHNLSNSSSNPILHPVEHVRPEVGLVKLDMLSYRMFRRHSEGLTKLQLYGIVDYTGCTGRKPGGLIAERRGGSDFGAVG